MDPQAMAESLRGSQAKHVDQETADAVREFDSYFLAEILKSAQPDGEEHMLDGGSAGRMYQEQFLDEMARFVAKQGGFGVSEQVKELLTKSEGPTAGRAKEEPS